MCKITDFDHILTGVNALMGGNGIITADYKGVEYDVVNGTELSLLSFTIADTAITSAMLIIYHQNGDNEVLVLNDWQGFCPHSVEEALSDACHWVDALTGEKVTINL